MIYLDFVIKTIAQNTRMPSKKKKILKTRSGAILLLENIATLLFSNGGFAAGAIAT